MTGFEHIGRVLIVVGLVIVAMGGLLLLSGKLTWFGKLPGDIIIKRENFTFYFPLATCILISIFLSLIFWLLGKR
jgi:hypothetical protein